MADRSSRRNASQRRDEESRSDRSVRRADPDLEPVDDEFVTDAEMEAREANSSPQDEDPRRFSESD
jgi:hypothetical protein